MILSGELMIMKTYMPSILFKKLTLIHLTEFQKIFNDEELCQFINCPYPLTRQWVRNYIINAMDKFKKEERFTWAVINKKTNLLIGVTVLKNIDRKNRVLEIGYCLEKNSWYKGYTELAVMMLIEYAFIKLHINRVEIRVDCENTRTIKFMDKIGAEQEGRMRQALYENGRFHDIYLYSIIYDDFLRWKVNKKPLYINGD